MISLLKRSYLCAYIISFLLFRYIVSDVSIDTLCESHLTHVSSSDAANSHQSGHNNRHTAVNDRYVDVESGYNDLEEDFVEIPVEAVFFNTLPDEALSLYWQADDPVDDVFIEDIDPLSISEVNTYLYHTFYAVLKSNPTVRADPATITVNTTISPTFKFGPEQPGYVKRREHPKVQYTNTESIAMGVRFKSLVPYPVSLWYDDGYSGIFQGHFNLGQEGNSVAYIGQRFYVTEKDNKNKVVAKLTLEKGKNLYVIRDHSNPPPENIASQVDQELKFIEEYKSRTGDEWRHYYGSEGSRSSPRLYMREAPEVGFTKTIESSQGYWSCDGPSSECQDQNSIKLDLEVISVRPKVFVVENLTSAFECDHIIDLASSNLKESRVGNKQSGELVSSTRTSQNTWISRKQSDIVDTIYKRVAHLIKIDERLLVRDHNAEELQVVRYQKDQKFDVHHDFNIRNTPNSRYLTLLIYLSDQEDDDAGGETGFPLALDSKGFKIHPGKGNAILFYNLLEDGNADELAAHSGITVSKGVKWICNLWVWDPMFEY